MAETTNLAVERATSEQVERSAHEIRQDIASKRENISETVDKLSERIHQTLDWREYIGQYPIAALGVAVGVGFLVSGIFKHRPTPQERIADAVAEITEDLTDRISDIAADTLKRKFISGKTVKTAITGLITKAAIDLAKKQLSARVLGTGAQGRNEQRGYGDEQTGQLFQSTRPLH